MKIVKEPHVLEATSLLGYPESLLVVLGLVVLGCTLVYVTPRSRLTTRPDDCETDRHPTDAGARRSRR
jgi:hypothetical protein